MVILVATVLVFLGVTFLSRSGGPGPMGLLYSGLDGASAGEVITALEARGVAYEVKGSAIYVPEVDRDLLRMNLAGEGLPSIGDKGYELLDNLSGFGTTSQMFDAAYWRAKEGELARTILAAPHIKTARVHISAPSNRPFQRDLKPSAAVTVGSTSGVLSAEQGRALRYLVASAVSGMSPMDVSVIDRVGGLVASGDEVASGGGDDPRAEALKSKVERLVAARVGYGNAVVEVSLETISASEHILERTFDPESRVAISSENEERSTTNENGDAGQVTVASNLPEGDARASTVNSSSKSNETRERTNYEVSETKREVTKGPGDIRRMTVAVLVNHENVVQADGAVVSTPRSAEELAVLKSLVASAVGFNGARGDVITLETMAFDASGDLGSEAGTLPGVLASWDMMSLVQYLVAGAVALILGLFVVKPILMAGRGQGVASTDLIPSAEMPDLLEPSSAMDDAGDADGGLPELDFSPPGEFGGFDTITDFSDMGFDDGSGDGDPADRLRNLITERQDETLQVLQSWLDVAEPNGESA